MGRQKQPEIRERLLAACTDALLETGTSTGLAALAARAGTSPRMLVYHFGGRDRLVREALHQARQRQLALFGEALAPRAGVLYADVLAQAWQTLTGPQGAPYLRLFGQLNRSADEALWPDFRREATTDWLGPLQDGLGPGSGDLATVVLAVIRGLLLDRDSTGDLDRTAAAFSRFVGLLPR